MRLHAHSSCLSPGCACRQPFDFQSRDVSISTHTPTCQFSRHLLNPHPSTNDPWSPQQHQQPQPPPAMKAPSVLSSLPSLAQASPSAPMPVCLVPPPSGCSPAPPFAAHKSYACQERVLPFSRLHACGFLSDQSSLPSTRLCRVNPCAPTVATCKSDIVHSACFSNACLCNRGGVLSCAHMERDGSLKSNTANSVAAAPKATCPKLVDTTGICFKGNGGLAC